MKPNNYEVPALRLFEVKLEGILNASRASMMEALGNSSMESTTEYDNGSGSNVVSW